MEWRATKKGCWEHEATNQRGGCSSTESEAAGWQWRLPFLFSFQTGLFRVMRWSEPDVQSGSEQRGSPYGGHHPNVCQPFLLRAVHSHTLNAHQCCASVG